MARIGYSPLPTTQEWGEGQGEGFLVSCVDLATIAVVNSTGNARRLRRKQTSEGKQLWRALRAGRFAGFKFRRQHPLATYFLDFIVPPHDCPSNWMVLCTVFRMSDAGMKREQSCWKNKASKS